MPVYTVSEDTESYDARVRFGFSSSWQKFGTCLERWEPELEQKIYMLRSTIPQTFLPTYKAIMASFSTIDKCILAVISVARTILVVKAGCPGKNDHDHRGLQMIGPGNQGGNGIGGGMIGQLFDNRVHMNRTVEFYDNGTIVALTESEIPEVATLLQNHLAHMQYRVQNGIQARNWDPFFVAWFDKYTEFTVDVVNTTSGVLVTMSAWTPCGQALLDGHTAVVDLFVATGREEGEKEHAIPPLCVPTPTPTTPEPTNTPIISPSDTETPTAFPPNMEPSSCAVFWGVCNGAVSISLLGVLALLYCKI